MSNICPVCGYPELGEPPYRGTYKGGLGSLEICPSCRFQFGFTDDSKHITHEQWRKQWIEGGMLWRKGREAPPAGWDPKKQLLNIGIKA